MTTTDTATTDTATTDTDTTPGPDDEERNRAVVTELFARLAAADVDGIAAHLDDSFVSHNPRVPHDPATTTGRDAFVAFLRGPEGRALLAAAPAIRRLAVDGDHVWAHAHLTVPGTPGAAAVDILRLRDGKVVEHWDVVQPIPEAPVHPHGMF
jgi:predicted SnoaL-like aldol condensation-catalyzing enzyme